MSHKQKRGIIYLYLHIGVGSDELKTSIRESMMNEIYGKFDVKHVKKGADRKARQLRREMKRGKI